jgi:hypothetical protein
VDTHSLNERENRFACVSKERKEKGGEKKIKKKKENCPSQFVVTKVINEFVRAGIFSSQCWIYFFKLGQLWQVVIQKFGVRKKKKKWQK